MSQESHDRVLIADDNEANVDILETRLTSQGYQVITARDGAEGLAAARSHHPDLILLDIMMPDIDGYEVCQRIKQDPATQGAAIIFLSALSDTKDKVKGLDLGAVDYITKPFHRSPAAAAHARRR